jgi:hypothetical protein
MLKGAEGTASHLLNSKLIHRSDQLSTGQGVGSASLPAQRTPPIGELCRGMYCVLSQKIFAKVKAALCL